MVTCIGFYLQSENILIELVANYKSSVGLIVDIFYYKIYLQQ